MSTEVSRATSSCVSRAVLQTTRVVLYCILCSPLCSLFFSNLPQLPHIVQQYFNRDSTSGLYSFFNASTERIGANLMPEIADEIFLHISCTCLSHRLLSDLFYQPVLFRIPLLILFYREVRALSKLIFCCKYHACI